MVDSTQVRTFHVRSTNVQTAIVGQDNSLSGVGKRFTRRPFAMMNPYIYVHVGQTVAMGELLNPTTRVSSLFVSRAYPHRYSPRLVLTLRRASPRLLSNHLQCHRHPKPSVAARHMPHAWQLVYL